MRIPLRFATAALALAVLVPAAHASAAPAPNVYVLGDSVTSTSRMVLERELRSMFGRVVIDGAACRGITYSCRHPVHVPTPPPSGLAVARSVRSGLGKVVVVELGYNILPTRKAVDALVSELRRAGVQLVLWVNMSQHRARFATGNQVLAKADRELRPLKVLDWDGYSRSHPEWFVDGIHLTSTGSRAFARFVRDEVARLTR